MFAFLHFLFLTKGRGASVKKVKASLHFQRIQYLAAASLFPSPINQMHLDFLGLPKNPKDPPNHPKSFRLGYVKSKLLKWAKIALNWSISRLI